MERVLDRSESAEAVSAPSECTQSTPPTGADGNGTPHVQKVVYYLVKWRSLQFEDSSWELPSDVDPERIREWETLQRPPNPDDCKLVLFLCFISLIHYL